MNHPATAVLVWWLGLCFASALNAAAWLAIARGRYGAADRRQLALSAIFVAGCAFRSVSPLAEAQRICLFDWWFARAPITRVVATLAELAFVTQCALTLRGHAGAAGSRAAAAVAWLMVPLIAFAEACSWYTALTTNFLGSVLEESTWAVTFAALSWGLVRVRHAQGPYLRRFLASGAVVGLGYVVFMTTVDVPMYWARWQRDSAAHARYLGIAQGWHDAWRRQIVTRRWEDWREEVPWMSLYFSMAVWMSLALTRAQAPRPGSERAHGASPS